MEPSRHTGSGEGTFDRTTVRGGGGGGGGGYVSEIEEVEEDAKEGNILSMNNLSLHDLPSIREDIDGISLCSSSSRSSEDCVYVGVGKSESSMDALAWTLKHAVEPGRSTTIFLVHVFPEIRFVPSPLGNLPISRVNREQLESFMAQEGAKRRDLLQKFLNSCHASKVKVDTVLIESDMVAKAIIDLIPVLNISKLVVGTSKSSLRRLRARKGSGVAGQLLQSVPESCDFKIICDGNQVALDQLSNDQSPPSSPAPLTVNDNGDRSASVQEGNRSNSYVSCTCFRSKFIA